MCHDRTLWMQVDFAELDKDLDLNSMKKFLRSPQATHLRSFTIRGCLRRLRNRPRLTVTTAFLQEMHERCPLLRHLTIREANISNVQLQQFPPGLEGLSLQDSIATFDFFRPLSDPAVLPSLKSLNLNGFNSLSSNSASSVPGILSRSELKALNLSGLFKLSLAHICSLPKSLQQLEVLEMSRTTNVTDELLKQIAQFCTGLKRLDVSHSGISDVGIEHLAVTRRCPIEILFINQTKITDLTIKVHLSRLLRLKVIHAAKCDITESVVDQFRLNFPSVILRSQFSDVNNHSTVGGGLWHISLDNQD